MGFLGSKKMEKEGRNLIKKDLESDWRLVLFPEEKLITQRCPTGTTLESNVIEVRGIWTYAIARTGVSPGPGRFRLIRH